MTKRAIRGAVLLAFTACLAVGGGTSAGVGATSPAPPASWPAVESTSAAGAAGRLQLELIPASATNPFRYVVSQLMAAGPACPVRTAESESALWTAGLQRKVAAFAGSGLVTSDPPAWVGDMLGAAAGFGAAEVFAGSTDADVAWLLKTATEHEAVQAAVGKPFVIQMERHDLDGRQMWILTHTFAAFDGC